MTMTYEEALKNYPQYFIDIYVSDDKSHIVVPSMDQYQNYKYIVYIIDNKNYEPIINTINNEIEKDSYSDLMIAMVKEQASNNNINMIIDFTNEYPEIEGEIVEQYYFGPYEIID